ncbi:MAG: glycosyltransferase family 2 protein [Paludibacter sp.]|nr:glycosyltransferase family 2 protein [Paludibacter sp.]
MAVYNGEKFLKEQLESILCQLSRSDEVIIVDDKSTDSSLKIIRSFQDKRIKIFSNEKNIGVIKSFERAIEKASGDFIFLSDQDDVWMPDKVTTMIAAFDSPKILGVVSDAVVVGPCLEILNDSFFSLRKSGPGLVKNFYKNSFVGCCMAIKKETKKLILPFPKLISMHDEWIGFVLSISGKVKFIPEKLIMYRRHGNNATFLKNKNIIFTIKKRLRNAIAILKYFIKNQCICLR